MPGIFDGAFNVGGHTFDMDDDMDDYRSGVLIRIIPTYADADLAFCSSDLLQYCQEWTPLGHQRWLREREARRGGEA
jgi:hypothetical protein